jgi:non-specific serine/threonine protein kinase/serine/threonine-protein kinase
MPHEAAKPQLTPERWQHIRGLLAELIEVPDQDRPAFLSSACGDDTNLRTQLEDLLRMHEATEARGLDQAPVAEISAALADRLRGQDIGHRIGAYRVEAEIARGGMGTVYRAIRADDEYKKQVAIKVVDRGMLSRRSAELFRHERQILANLEHPNIARLLDGGTNEDGSPYLVMEYVEGETITRYCDSHRLSIEERLKLFQKICSAVHFAHQNLIIHRDIKPANILVTQAGEPKLLDFGIAKVIGADAGAETETRTCGGMTPAYASPEQLNGHAVTTATDVYSLGLVLYELLTGRYAYEQFSTPARRQNAILDEDPQRPSQAVLRASVDIEQPVTPEHISALRQLPVEKLSRRLAGDLESIVAKAIHKQPEHRYSSMAQFSEDISRHRRGEPVIARQNTFIYRSIKFVRRHKLGIAAGVLMFVLVVTGMVVIVRAERKARAEQEIAESRFNDLRKLANSLMFEVHDAIKDLPGATPARKLVVSKALEYLDRLSKDASNDPTLQRELATAYQRVGDVQGGSADANLGDYAGALASYRKALRIREMLAKARPQDAQLRQELASGYLQVGTLTSNTEALADLHRSVDILKALTATRVDPALLNQLAGAYYYLAAEQVEQGDVDSSLTNHFQALSIRKSIRTSDPALMRTIQMRLPGDYGAIAQLLRIQREFDQALEYQRKAVTLTSQLSQVTPQNQTIKRYLGSGYFYLGLTDEEAGNRHSAVVAYEKGAAILETIHDDDPLNEAVVQDLAFLNSHLGELEVEGGATSQGFEKLRSAVSTWDNETAKHPGNDDFGVSRAISYFEMGRAYAFLASKTSGSQAETRLWRNAQLFLQQSDRMWHDLQTRHVVPIWEREIPIATTKALAECDSRLIKLAKQSKWKDGLPG